ncbi:NAD(P)/FAD-dependent oxidoreductase [Pseudonocardia asaccharolytica]|uniref:Ferredoxin--NADP reductase n=1 Tax=Pseudonocardia asaccharolytica DSM 44247 = NBRC 16224 TaxID=1123024 RepID=A0A511CVG7_9PSEU|nr:NAD(P)/FAD-dependent oxidoreductase [Pseudonocardia asaccharolytica]GEL16579.1 ferredoxin--NADP reductase [Pseudonocardia asaccharolytica DSM 44247 = NBRC 16224]
MTGHADALDADLVIVGAGPCGLYATYYAGFRGLSVVVIDALEQPGGQMAALYPEKPVFDVAGFPRIKAQDLVDSLVEQASLGKPHYLLGHRAVELDETPEEVVVTTDQGAVVRAGALLITGGIGGFRPRPLPVGGEFVGRGVRYFVPRLAELAGHDVLVVGGGDSAVDWALSLEPVARSVALVHRREAFRAHEHSVARLRASSVRVLTPLQVAKIRGGDRVEEVDVVDAGGTATTLAVTEVVAALGFHADLGALATWGLDLRRRHILVDRSMRTNRPRVFAAGDITDFDGKVKLISVGFGEAALAVNNLTPLVRPGLSTVPGHSSDAA